VSLKRKFGPYSTEACEVPKEWEDCAFEYRHGWSYATTKYMHNPISHTSPDGLRRRQAWYVGREAGAEHAGVPITKSTSSRSREIAKRPPKF
jgi:hypothetical protein